MTVELDRSLQPTAPRLRKGLKGLFCYLATPFDSHGNVDEGKLREYVSHMLSLELDGLTCLASTCEGPYLTESEWQKVLQIVGSKAGGVSKLNVGIGAYSTRQTIENARRARDAGATSLMVEMPQYYPLSFEEVYRHYATLADTVDVPIRLYNLTVATRFDFTPELLQKMANIPGIVSVKEASGDVSRLGKIRELSSSRFELFCGFHYQALEGMRLGADGWEIMMHPVIASELIKLYAHLQTDPWSERSEVFFARLKPLFDFFKKNGVPQSIKAMSEWTSLPFGDPRKPLRSLNPVEKNELRAILLDCGIS